MNKSKEPVLWLLWTFLTTCFAMLFQYYHLVFPLFVAGLSIAIKVLVETNLYTRDRV